MIIRRLEEVKDKPTRQCSMAQKRYVSSDEDWDYHRKRIENLFIDRGMTLRDVAAAMERCHNFRAT